MEMHVTMTGVDALVRRYSNAQQIITKSLTGAVTRSVIFGEGIAKRIVARDTSNLARSITHRVESGIGRVRGIWGTAVFYGPYVEKGTRPHFPPVAALVGWARRHGANPYAVARGIALNGTRAQPFMKPSFEQTKPKAIQDIRNAARTAFRQIAGG
jgi:HK97 gp10 family phage protein